MNRLGTDNPLISIITACFNAEEFIEQCIASVIGQTFDDFEYVVIDGGSSDGTTAIIERYRDYIAYYQSRADRGIADAFNQGIDHAKGRWIGFLNADDCYCGSEVLASMAENLYQNDSVDLVYGQVQIIKRQGTIAPVSGVVGDTWRWREFRLRSTIPHPAAFTHCKFFKKYGNFDERFRNALDYELYLRAGSEMKAVFVPHLITWMRDGGMSKDDSCRSYRESRDAQIKNKLFGKITSWMIYLVYVVRFFLSQLVAKR